MKKSYFTPVFETVNIAMHGSILQASGGGVNDDYSGTIKDGLESGDFDW